ncbi:hypothetical protein KQI41_03995 [Tissierella pigra]|uniref:Lipoprotein n=1 Tax=Tissierella pigra TaxID=2607614 RepID=A0A6N7XYL4_9FIRM|nr:hypothetical protein [Tissierella pigra]MBU5425566.1 hypothetical protein [Tissierella pigra]MSU00880.1 hypothetical protein [Tissierella pigra]
MSKVLSKKFKLSILIILVLLVSTGCMPGDGSYNSQKPANFLSGIWHGWIAPISLIFSIGKSNIRIYETINTGFGYDLGFYIAIISGFGGLSLSRKKRKGN